ncbi:hypothetical protein [Shewanella sp. UCD-KL12]|uniref:hypothetical protein n=1 Tax=Shewanella sp. UCD-KL12 TaxID=1917163 RepID=UPI000970DD09|nr:hypothetical protein [Shewanella sp. UCD-KL12]
MNNKDQENYQGMPFPPHQDPAALWHAQAMHYYGYPPQPMTPPPGYYPPQHMMPPQPMMPPQGHPQMHPHAHMHQHQGQFQHGHPHMHHNGHQDHGSEHHGQSDAIFQQAQGMLEGMMGDQAGIFKDLIHKLGVDDKEFWKGAMIGAAAAMIMSNENVRNSMMQMFMGAGDMLKTGADKVKQGSAQTASSVKNNVNAGSEIFRETYQAGKQGFNESVERHRAPDEATPTEPNETPEPASVTPESEK